MDVKWLPGWEEDVRIKSVNIVDEASKLATHLSFLRDRDIGGSSTTVSSVDTILRKAPLAQSRCKSNQLGENVATNARGRGHPKLLDVPGEAHEQVGRVEVHGRHFEDMLA